jgi:cadmium resistance protein CadD (predicted permease)
MIYRTKKEWMFVIGVFSLIIANLLKFFGGNFLIADFFEGMFTGISLVMNLCYLIRFSSEKRMKCNLSQNKGL